MSDVSQNEDRQLDAMAELAIPQAQIFVDKQSGKDFKRPAWQKMVKKLRQGDLLYVKSIDRLGRDYSQILENWRILTKEMGVDIAVLDMLPLLDTRNGQDLVGTFLADAVLSLLSFVAQKERDDSRIRQREGIKAARKRGVHMGRPIKKPPENFAAVVKEWECGKISFEEALAQTGLKQATFYNRLRELRGGKQK